MQVVAYTDSPTVRHPDVAAWQVQAGEQEIVVAVMLRPIVGRAARRKVLDEVGRMVLDETAHSTEDDACVRSVYVVADIDVYQAILHGQEVDGAKLATRSGCVVVTR